LANDKGPQQADLIESLQANDSESLGLACSGSLSDQKILDLLRAQISDRQSGLVE
jgi:hypothetical protein